jgi:hypothetical protein
MLQAGLTFGQELRMKFFLIGLHTTAGTWIFLRLKFIA